MTEHSLDVGPWDADLRALAGSPAAEIRREAVAVLGLHLARSGRHDEVRALCESGDSATVCGALKGLRMAGTAATPHLDRVRALLDAEDKEVRGAAWNVVRDMHDGDTVAAVTRCLDSRPGEVRKDTTWYLRQAAEKGADVRPALPRLQVLARERDSSLGDWARRAIANAAVRHPEEADAVAVLVEQLRSLPSDMKTRPLASRRPPLRPTRVPPASVPTARRRSRPRPRSAATAVATC